MLETKERPLKNITLSIYVDQYEEMKRRNMEFSQSYRDAWDEKYRGVNQLQKELDYYLLKAKEIEKQIEGNKTRKLSVEEMQYLKASKTSLQGTSDQLNTRFISFKRLFDRDFWTLEEFIKVVEQVNKIK